MRYAVDDGILVITLSSEVPAAAVFMTELGALMEDESIPRGLPVLVDVRRAKSAPSAGEVRGVSAFFHTKAHFFGTVSAVLVSTSLQYGVGRMGSAYEAMQDRTLRVFFDEAEARAFLKSPPPDDA